VRYLSSGGDPFISLAADWLGVPPQRVTPAQRGRAKQCVYGIIYGMGVPVLAARLGVSMSEASTLMRSFSSRFPTIRRW
jgi:DNA polymerase I-like protein with 3'-5' exonuclease and polymerase domains